MSKKKKSRAKQPRSDASSPAPLVGEESSPVPSPGANPPATPNQNSVMSGSRLSRFVSFGLLLGVIALVSVLFYEVMARFLVPLFLAALLVVVFRPLHRWIMEKTGGREKTSALLTTISVLLSVLVPIGVLLVMAAAESRQLYGEFNSTKVIKGVRQIRTNLNLDMPSKRQLRLIESELHVLQQKITLSPAEEYTHQAALYDIEQSARKLGDDQGLAWPEAATATTDPASDWIQFATCLGQARALHDQIPWQAGATSSGDELKDGVREYQAKLNETADHFSRFQTQLLGGKTRAWAVELLNPSDEEAESYIHSIVAYGRDQLLGLTGAGVAFVGNLLLGTAIMVIGLYFFLLDGPKMIESFKGLSPIDDEHEQELVTEFGNVSRAVVVATLLSALAQGLLAGVGFYFAGIDSVFLLTVLSAMLAMVPFVGAASVWVPCCLYLYFFDDNLAAAIGLGIYGAAVISMADNVIKPLVLHGHSNIHPLFALLSVLGGVSTLGPIGILIGPMVVAFLQTLLKILKKEMTDLDQMSQSNPA